MDLKSRIRGFILDEAGQSTTEYILILAVVVMVAVKFKEVFQGKLQGIIGTLGDKIDSGVQDAGGP